MAMKPGASNEGVKAVGRRADTVGVSIGKLQEGVHLAFGVSRLLLDALNHEILWSFTPAQHGVHSGFGKIPGPKATKSIS